MILKTDLAKFEADFEVDFSFVESLPQEIMDCGPIIAGGALVRAMYPSKYPYCDVDFYAESLMHFDALLEEFENCPKLQFVHKTKRAYTFVDTVTDPERYRVFQLNMPHEFAPTFTSDGFRMARLYLEDFDLINSAIAVNFQFGTVHYHVDFFSAFEQSELSYLNKKEFSELEDAKLVVLRAIKYCYRFDLKPDTDAFEYLMYLYNSFPSLRVTEMDLNKAFGFTPEEPSDAQLIMNAWDYLTPVLRMHEDFRHELDPFGFTFYGHRYWPKPR